MILKVDEEDNGGHAALLQGGLFASLTLFFVTLIFFFASTVVVKHGTLLQNLSKHSIDQTEPSQWNQDESRGDKEALLEYTLLTLSNTTSWFSLFIDEPYGVTSKRRTRVFIHSPSMTDHLKFDKSLQLSSESPLPHISHLL
ncbi:Uncharacterized protein Rs2_11579 [Raphanus sativus]|nr:Uncharacterized protein Rs2_11579 [Raphanus sativus]